MGPAFRDVGASGTLADGVQLSLLEKTGNREEVLMGREFDLQPRRLFFGL